VTDRWFRVASVELGGCVHLGASAPELPILPSRPTPTSVPPGKHLRSLNRFGEQRITHSVVTDKVVNAYVQSKGAWPHLERCDPCGFRTILSLEIICLVIF
jgi:hypothetical protein